MKNYKDMRVKDLKNILSNLPDDMPIVIPVIDEENVNHIFGFRLVRTAGILSCDSEKEREVLCINSSNDSDGQDLADQIYFSHRDVNVDKVLFGSSKYGKKVKHNV